MELREGKDAFTETLPGAMESKWHDLEEAFGDVESLAYSAFDKRGVRYHRFQPGTAPAFLVIQAEPEESRHNWLPSPCLVMNPTFEREGCLMEFGQTGVAGKLDPGTYFREASIMPQT